MGSILSIDYGKKRIGLAVSDPSRIFAFPYGIVENKNINHVISSIKEIIDQKEIDLIIIGMPYHMNFGKSLEQAQGEMEKIVQAFVKKLKEAINIPINIVDERLSSFAANENLKEIGISAKKSKKLIDEEAARLLLEDFLRNN